MKQIPLVFLLLVIIFYSCQQSNKTSENVSEKKILFVTSNAHIHNASNVEFINHFPEIILAYNVFKNRYKKEEVGLNFPLKLRMVTNRRLATGRDPLCSGIVVKKVV